MIPRSSIKIWGRIWGPFWKPFGSLRVPFLVPILGPFLVPKIGTNFEASFSNWLETTDFGTQNWGHFWYPKWEPKFNLLGTFWCPKWAPEWAPKLGLGRPSRPARQGLENGPRIGNYIVYGTDKGLILFGIPERLNARRSSSQSDDASQFCIVLRCTCCTVSPLTMPQTVTQWV